jgi:hypothetical protein
MPKAQAGYSKRSFSERLSGLKLVIPVARR